MADGRGRGVALGGFMGSGKSTVGAALAAALALPFVDTDDVLAQRFGPIPTQFRDDGEPVFRARERAVVAEIAGGAAAVVATGGGVWVDPENRRVLRRFGRLVVLHAPLEVLAARVGAGDGRPVWDAAVAERFAAREECYRDADLRIDVSRARVDEIVEEIRAWLIG